MKRRQAYTPPSSSLLRWLTGPSADIAPHFQQVLRGDLFIGPRAIATGVLNGLVLNSVALLLHCGMIFAILLLLDVALAVLRVAIARRSAAAARRQTATPTDLNLILAIAWSALQGGMAFAAMGTGSGPLQVLAATSVFALIGPILARNYIAPRLAFLMVCLCELPFVAGAMLSGDPWLLVLLAQTPLFVYGTWGILSRIQRMMVSMLQAQLDSQHSARHDWLTGVLNRSGLIDVVAAGSGDLPHQSVLFYLDLDGFKNVNDTLGHQAGDRLLQDVAARLRASTRIGDIVARLGGDEFVILALDLPMAEAADLADKILRRIIDEPCNVGDGLPARIGVSIGFACCPEDGMTLDDLLGKADAALYEVKRAGKGQRRRFTQTAAANASGRTGRDVSGTYFPSRPGDDRRPALAGGESGKPALCVWDPRL